MSANGIPHGAVDLGQPSQVTVRDMRLLPVASVQFMKGGCDRPNCPIRVEIVDIVNGVVWLVPMTETFARTLHAQLGDHLQQLTQSKQEGN